MSYRLRTTLTKHQHAQSDAMDSTVPPAIYMCPVFELDNIQFAISTELQLGRVGIIGGRRLYEALAAAARCMLLPAADRQCGQQRAGKWQSVCAVHERVMLASTEHGECRGRKWSWHSLWYFVGMCGR